MSDLVAFWRARLDEDEAAARRATAGPWRYDPTREWRDPDRPFSGGEESVFAGPEGDDATTVCCTGPSDDPPSMDDARHIARWDPARVLADVAAKRVIVEMHRPWGGSLPDGTIDCQICGWRRFGCLTLLALAQPYADHPDFDPAWRLEGTDRG